MSSRSSARSDDAVILSACRTPIGKFLGSLKGISATKLGSIVITEAVRRALLEPVHVDDVIMGNVVSSGLGQAPARQAALGAGIPDSVGALTLNMVCGSGLKAISLAAQAVRLGEAEVVVAGGMESMSNAPFLLQGARDGLRMGHGKLVDSVVHDGLWDAHHDFHMGQTAEVCAEHHHVSREAQDEYALDSHRKALAAIDGGKFAAEIVPVELAGRKGEKTLFQVDEGPRRDTSLEALGRLAPAFRTDGGTVTAGNAPGLNDGASAVVVTTRARAEQAGRKPMAAIRASATHGLAPALVMMAPEGAIRKVLQKAGWSIEDVDLFEINEAFAVQQVALRKVLGIPAEKHNVHGGAVALGHPIGASGARVLTTLLHALRDRGGRRGVAALCLGGGNGVAMAVELE